MPGLRSSRTPFRRAATAATLLTAWLVAAAPAAAHGEVTGVQDVIQDYGVLIFLAATVLIGAGVLAWVTFSPQPGEDEEEEDEEEEDEEEDEAAGDREGVEPAGVTGGAPAEVPATPGGSRASR